MDFHLTLPVELYQDYEATIHILHHKSYEARMISEFIQEGLNVVKYLSTHLITADTLTKHYLNQLLFHIKLVVS